jgi:hypothetical protein
VIVWGVAVFVCCACRWRFPAVAAGRFEMFEGLAEECWYRRCGETWRWRRWRGWLTGCDTQAPDSGRTGRRPPARVPACLQEPDDSVLGLADTRRARSPGPAGLPDGRSRGRSAIAGCRARARLSSLLVPGWTPKVLNEGWWFVPAAAPAPQPCPFTPGGGTAPRSAQRPDRVSPRRRVLRPR